MLSLQPSMDHIIFFFIKRTHNAHLHTPCHLEKGYYWLWKTPNVVVITHAPHNKHDITHCILFLMSSWTPMSFEVTGLEVNQSCLASGNKVNQENGNQPCIATWRHISPLLAFSSPFHLLVWHTNPIPGVWKFLINFFGGNDDKQRIFRAEVLCWHGTSNTYVLYSL
jgi:hypothetical protein